MDWTKALPFIGALATGGVPALVTTAASAISEALGSAVEPTQAGIDSALRNATPEQLATLKQVESALKVRLRELDTEDRRIAATTEQAYVSDVADARKNNSQTDGVLRLGYLINFASYACVAGVLYGCFELLGGQRLNIDPGIAAMIGGIVGAAVQWLMSNAAQANGFFFGSSPSSRQAHTELARAVGDAATSLKK